MPISFKTTVSGTKEWIAFLVGIPSGATKVVLQAFAKYVLGDSKHGLKHPAAYRYVSRKSAYGKTWFSAAQRRWFFANGAKIGNFRTGRLIKGWQMWMAGPNMVKLTNSVPYANWVIGEGQARQPKKVGWRTAWEVLMSNYKGGIRAAQAALNVWLGSK